MKKGEKVTLLSCYLELPGELIDVGGIPKKRTFISAVEYSYNAKKEVPFVVKRALVPQPSLT
jgi:hypothetical protein